MRRFGVEIKNKEEIDNQKQQRLVNKSTSEEDAKIAARQARFGVTQTTQESELN